MLVPFYVLLVVVLPLMVMELVEEQEDIEILMLQNNLVDYLLGNRLGHPAALDLE